MGTPVEAILALTSSLISFQSVTGQEQAVAAFLLELIKAQQWHYELIRVDAQRYNILATVGQPRIVFSTHMDVVPAPAALFEPVRVGGVLRGRGACDAKGSLATMFVLAQELSASGNGDFGLLFVVGEERDGIGAKTAAHMLQGRGIEHFINGEPTEGRFASATKGILDFEVEFTGRACHSGYPQHGEDANRALIACAQTLYSQDFGHDPVLGSTLVNVGVLAGGTASNVISPSARLSCCIRTVADSNAPLKAALQQLLAPAIPRFSLDAPAVHLQVPEWEAQPYLAAYGTDVPHYLPLGCNFYLCGPGSIVSAHTDDEQITSDEIATAYEQYQRLFQSLRG